jgi:CCR4-NOT transcription complex subunit 3
MNDADVGAAKVEEQQPQQNLPDDSIVDSTSGSGLGKNLMNEEDLKASYAIDSPVR